MLSELSYSCLEKEIQFLRLDLDGLAVELDIQQIYQKLYNPAVTGMYRIEEKMALFNWKKTRLEALELFARAQQVITEMKQPAPVQLPCTNRIYKRKKRPKNKTRAIGLSGDPKFNSVPQNAVHNNSNKENQGPLSTQALTSQVRTYTAKNTKNEGANEMKDSKDTIVQSIADTLKNLKKEDIDHDQISVFNNNINANFIPQLLLPPANIKVEGVDGNMVNNEANKGRKRKSRSARRRSKKIKTE